jgi:methylenetetrahydrofolate--tRNA-(uracil-5-)-methyltransferase
MVCSNSLKSDAPASATGILKAEMECLGSIILTIARKTRVPAGLSLAVDRTLFAQAVTERLRGHRNIEWKIGLQNEPPANLPTIIATGPLTADPLAEWVSRTFGESRLFFYDAIAPIVEKDSINASIAFSASRYGKGAPDFLNCPLDADHYNQVVNAMLSAPRAPIHEFEPKFFEACLPIETLAERGRDTLRFGPMKPVGLTDPRTGRRPYAVVQLRQDSIAGDLFNLVGFQTRISWNAQPEVFRLIPGLENAAFSRLGSMHRNTYICSPRILDATLATKDRPSLFFAGQICGVEGYLESAASGLAAAIAMDRHLRNLPAHIFPRQTMIGSMLHYIANACEKDFAPINAMMGILPELPEGAMDIKPQRKQSGSQKNKAAKREALRKIALEGIREMAAMAG